ncbi:YrrS family protein [Aquibacillus salsiterrae]|uniref:YrrS family protein n=1 Tax=Aquibacillus salsiterrae TaxID=2950439 RepID=A0A9X3WCS0_9BACI|nr:YrrS family protein [Aquibacillus salsiterrae]MDC3415605.1 YrrS family protein [Aquibacillus salsiterrae]
MPKDFRTYTRLDRFEKKRKNTKAISWLLVLGGLCVVALISLILFGPDDSVGPAQTVSGEKQNSETTNPDDDSSQSEQSVDDGNLKEGEQNTNTNDDNSADITIVQSDDDNVLEAYEGNWDPVETVQQEPHTITFEQDSTDWKEMMRAVEIATGLTTDNMIQWWVERDGEQKVNATVSDKAESEIYRVYVSWIENQGWMPTKVERLKENDQKRRFETDSSEQSASE